MYADHDHGVSLIDAVQDKWYVFSDKLHTSGRSRALLEDILNSNWDDDDGEPPVDAWDLVRAREVLPDLDSWEDFCLNVRDDPDLEPDFGETFDEDLENTSPRTPLERCCSEHARVGVQSWTGKSSHSGEGRLGHPHQRSHQQAVRIARADQYSTVRKMSRLRSLRRVSLPRSQSARPTAKKAVFHAVTSRIKPRRVTSVDGKLKLRTTNKHPRF
jgi:hypothetical protein